VAEIITCPQCQRKLRLDETVLGETVQCPSCQNTFVAEKPALPAPPPPPRTEYAEWPGHRVREVQLPRHDESRPPCPAEDDEDYPRPPRRPYYDDYPRQHRGAVVLTLGILGLFFSFCGLLSVVGLIVSIIAIVLGASDLAAMNRGEMDPSGRGRTKAGLICAIIALVLTGLSCVGGMVAAILNGP
jgi:hypothetical protein